MKKRLLSLLLAVMMVVSVITISVGSVSAAENNQNASSADGNFYFAVPDFWQTDYGIIPGDSRTTVFCYIFTVGGSDPDFPSVSWQSKGTKCTWNADKGLYEYPVATKYSLKDDADYCVIFSARESVNSNNPQCYDLTMGTDCLGDTVYLTTQTYENPQDSKKVTNAAYWTSEANAAKYGPHAGITSLGVLQGEKYAPHEDKELAIANFIHDFSANAKPETCPNLCEQIGVEAYDVYVKYSTAYAADIEAGVCPALDVVAGLLGLDYPPVPPTSEVPTTEVPTTAAPTTEPATTEPATTEPATTEPPTTPAKKYTVAGDSGLTGVMWDPASNEMTEGSYEFDGNTYDYAITFEDVAAGAYGFKVTNGTWDEAYPAGNFTFSTGDTGYVKVYFNSDTKEIAVDAQYPKTWQLESIIAVGNGDGTWLNGANWDLTDKSNLMTEVESGIWEITYEDIEAYDGYEVKFACNQSWQPYNWTITGELDGQTNTPQVVDQDGSKVTLRLDVRGFDFATGTGTVVPQFIVTPPVVPTTEPTTVAPTTAAPTTEPATTEPATTVPVMTESPTTPAKKYTVAGDSGLTGVMWDPASNEMTAGTYEFDGNTYDYAITFEDVAAGDYGFKVTNGTWDEAYPASNFTFSTGDTGYVKVYFNSDTKEIAVDAQYPKTWELESIIAVGNGDGAWLNGANWDLTDKSNLMTEVEPGIWEITYENIEAYDGYEVKFACNQSWQPYNWTIDGILDGQNNTPITVPFDNATVTLRIDVNGFDFGTGAGFVQTQTIIKNAKGHVIGDVDGDGEVSIKDASAIQMYLAKLIEDGDTFDAQVADFNADGRVNIFDVAAMQLTLARNADIVYPA